MTFENHQVAYINSTDFAMRQRVAGKAVATCLAKSKEMAIPGINLLEIEEACAAIITKQNCEPTFYQYKGFPGKICLSVNNELVHGIPHDYKLQEGDILKVDLGATYQAAIADAARTFVCGKAKDSKHIELISLCEKALYNAIATLEKSLLLYIFDGQDTRIGTIGNSIFRTVRDSKFGLITDYGGHGISSKIVEGKEIGVAHAVPFIANKAKRDEGIRVQPGMSLAIEPMLTLNGDTKTRVLKDSWTVLANSIAAHFEDTIIIHSNRVEVITCLQ
jgi:methionyl aminopeptidase